MYRHKGSKSHLLNEPNSNRACLFGITSELMLCISEDLVGDLYCIARCHPQRAEQLETTRKKARHSIFK